jgi:hypothetical protein
MKIAVAWLATLMIGLLAVARATPATPDFGRVALIDLSPLIEELRAVADEALPPSSACVRLLTGAGR